MSLSEGQPLEGPLLKVSRAKEHFDRLRREVEEFMATEPYNWRTEFEDFAGGIREYTVYADADEEPPIELGVTAGDVVQNLRAALDQLVWGLSDSGKRGRRTAFPIFLTEAEYRAKAPPMIEGLTEEGKIIEQWQPYRWGERASEHPLAILRHLSNTDKHRTLLPVALVRRNEYVAGYGEFKVEEIVYHDAPGGAVGWDEEIVMTFVTSGEPPGEVRVDAYLTFELAIEGHALTDLESIFLYIGQEILGSFDRG